MKKNNILFILVMLFAVSMRAQKYLNPRNLQFGTSMTAFYEFGNKNIYGETEQEYIWTFNIATSVSPRIQVGIENMMIWHNIYDKPNLLRSNLFGAFGQYSIKLIKNINLFGETGLFMGNYCSCSPGFSLRKKGMSYYSVGGGMNIILTKRFLLDLGFTFYNAIKKESPLHGHTKYVIGINYLINFKKTVYSNG